MICTTKCRSYIHAVHSILYSDQDSGSVLLKTSSTFLQVSLKSLSKFQFKKSTNFFGLHFSFAPDIVSDPDPYHCIDMCAWILSKDIELV